MPQHKKNYFNHLTTVISMLLRPMFKLLPKLSAFCGGNEKGRVKKKNRYP